MVDRQFTENRHLLPTLASAATLLSGLADAQRCRQGSKWRLFRRAGKTRGDLPGSAERLLQWCLLDGHLLQRDLLRRELLQRRLLLCWHLLQRCRLLRRRLL